MKDTMDSKKVVGSFVGKYITLAIIIGGISFILENVVPQFVNWDFTSALLIYQTVLFIVSTLLTITIALKWAIKGEKIETKEDAKKISKPVQTLLIIIALLVMSVNVIYYCGIRASYLKDAEKKYVPADGTMSEYQATRLELENEKIYAISGFYLSAKEIVTILVYAYAVVYVEMMLENEVPEKNKTSKKKETEKA